MAGLFGIVSTGASPAEEETAGLANAMTAALRHHTDDQLESQAFPAQGAFVARIGRPFHSNCPWPVSSNPLSFFIAGQLFARAQVGNSTELPAADDLAKWHGFFSAAFTDQRTGVTIIAVDRLASIPIYYAQTAGRVLFAPEVKALLADSSLPRDIDPEALASFIAQGYLLSDQTLFKSIRRLRGGQFLRIQNGIASVETYWRYAPGSAVDGASRADLERELGDLVTASATRHLGDASKTMIFLSGGADSRGILGGALSAVADNGALLNTITWGTGFGSSESDAGVAAQIAAAMKTRHRFVEREVSRFSADFPCANHLVDALSEIAAFHPHEHRIMQDLYAEGFTRVLRGDECFGWSYPAASHEAALALCKLRRLRSSLNASRIIRPEQYESLCAASDSAITKVLSEVPNLTPDQAKDYFYFSHRLQCYLQTASYYKQNELDQRNVLLDSSILDFLAKVPDKWRIDKSLYRTAMRKKFSRLAPFPFAKKDNLENWTDLLRGDTPVRAYVNDQLRDSASGVWQYLHRESLLEIMDSLRTDGGAPPPLSTKAKAKQFVKKSLHRAAPWLFTSIMTRNYSQPTYQLGLDKLVLRSIVLKDWYDTYVAT